MKRLYNVKFLIQKNEIFLGLSLILFVSSTIMGMTAFGVTENGNDNEVFMTIVKVMRYLAYVVCILKIFIDHKVNMSWIVNVILVAAFLAVGMVMVNYSRSMFLYFWLIIAATGVSDKKILKTIMYVQAVILCLTVLASQVGIINDIIEEDRVRHYLGFTWTTYAPILFFFIILQYLYICDLQLTFPKFVVFMIINIWFFIMTNTRLTFALLTVMLIFALIYHYTSIKKIQLEKLKYLFILAPEGIALFSVGLYVLYNSNSSLWTKLNDLLSGRLYYGFNAFNEYGITLFGQDITWYGRGIRSQVGQNGVEYNYVDCSYLQLLLQYGLIFLILVLVAYSVIMWKAIKEKRYSACWVILAVLVFAITEPWLTNLAYNSFTLLVLAKIEPEPGKNKDKRSELVLVLNKGSNREPLDA